jgi:hypothetical protein
MKAHKLLRVLSLILSSGIVYACSCLESSVQEKRDYSEIIFRGTIVTLRDWVNPDFPLVPGQVSNNFPTLFEHPGTVVFRVTRVWKGEVGQTFEMPAMKETSMCIGFWPPLLRVGTDLLVYASRYGGSEYTTAICGRHKLAKGAVDFGELGPGYEPKIPESGK